MTIECTSDGIAIVLEELYGPNNEGALVESALATEAPTAAGSIKYTAVTQGLLVMAEYVGTKKLVISGAVLLVALLVGNASADFVYGSATAFAVALVYVVSILRALRSKEISWR